MGDLLEIAGAGPETTALELLARMAEQIAAETLKPDGVALVWFTEDGHVTYDYSEGLGDEQLVAMFEIAKGLVMQEYLDSE